MKSMKLYEADDKMIDLISDNYSMLQGLNAFGIQLGFGDKTVEEVCRKQNVDCHTFLTVVNFLINGYTPEETDDRISVSTLLGYLRASHHYFLDFQLPSIRAKISSAPGPLQRKRPVRIKVRRSARAAPAAKRKRDLSRRRDTKPLRIKPLRRPVRRTARQRAAIAAYAARSLRLRLRSRQRVTAITAAG